MTDMEKLQKACETLAEAWNKALEALEPMEKLAKALNDAFGRMYASDECMLLRKRNVKFVLGEGINL